MFGFKLLKKKKKKKKTGGMAWSDDGKFVKIEQRPQDRPSLWRWIKSSINKLIDVRRRYPASIGKKIISAKKCV